MKNRKWMAVAGMLLMLTWIDTDGQVMNSWKPVDGLNGGSIQSLFELNEQTMLAGALYGGLYRSTDGGITWQFDGISGMTVYDLVQLSNGFVLAAVSQGVMLSRDGAAHWEHIEQIFDGFVLTFAETSAGIVYAGGRQGLFRSTDHGATWTAIDIGTEGAQVLSLCIGANDEVFAGTNNAGIRKSTDGMTNWTLADQVFENKRVLSIARRGMTMVTAGWLDSIYISTDNGTIWEARNGALDRPRVNAFLLTADGDIFAGMYTGEILRTTDNGGQWEELLPPSRSGVRCLYAASDGTLFAAVDGSGVLRSGDDGVTWTISNEGITNFRVPDILIDDEGALHASPYYWPWMKSTDGGRSWNALDTIDYTPKLLAVGSTGTLYCTREFNGVFVSTDGGAHWRIKNQGLDRPRFRVLGVAPDGHLFVVLNDRPHYHLPPGTEQWQELGGPLAEVRINCFFTAYGNLYTGVQEEGMFRSTDNGETWEKCTNGLTVSTITSLAAGPRGLMAGTYDGVFVSTDQGDTWTRFGNFIETVVTSIACAPDGDVYLSTTASGVLYYDTQSDDWYQMNDGLPDNLVDEIVIDPSGRLFARLNWQGFFRRDTEVTGIATSPPAANRPTIDQNYPNPFSPSTTIHYNLPARENVTLRITDVLGHEVSRPVDGETKAAGQHVIELHAAGLSPGVYYCILEAGASRSVLKMAIVR